MIGGIFKTSEPPLYPILPWVPRVPPVQITLEMVYFSYITYTLNWVIKKYNKQKRKMLFEKKPHYKKLVNDFLEKIINEITKPRII
jgi:hypothetical protein